MMVIKWRDDYYTLIKKKDWSGTVKLVRASKGGNFMKYNYKSNFHPFPLSIVFFKGRILWCKSIYSFNKCLLSTYYKSNPLLYAQLEH